MQTTTESPVIVYSFPNIRPINTVEEGIRQGHYTSHYDFITNKTVPLPPAQEPKNLYLVCFNRVIGETEFVGLLRAEGKQPCQNAPAYLSGLMAAVPEDKMPTALHNKDLVAAENNPSSVFTGRYGHRCFLCVSRHDADRRLGLAYVDGEWRGNWAFLAEGLVP